MTPRIVFGLLVVAFGLAMLLDNLDVLRAGDIIRYWPYGIMAVGVAYIVRGESRSEKVFGGIITAVGTLFLIVSRAFRPQDAHTNTNVQVGVVFGGASTPAARPGAPFAPGTGSQDPTYTEFAIFSGIERRVASPAFKRADLSAVMGGIEFDLRQAATEGEAVIEVFVTWGGIEIIVPPDWAVSNKITAIMGGVEDQSAGTQMSQHRLIIKGVVLMGGVTIKT
jgi:predicted membrane protein